MKRSFALLAVVAVVITACGDEDPVAVTTGAAVVETTIAGGADIETTGSTPTSTSPTVASSTTSLPDPGPGMTWRGALRVPEVLADFAIGPIWLDGEEITVGIADTNDLRRQGLMLIEDLGDLDGMVFIFEQEIDGGFWMKDTLIPLDIAFFDPSGAFVDGFQMEPCVTAECPSYVPSGSYLNALEMPAGDMPETPSFLSLVGPE